MERSTRIRPPTLSLVLVGFLLLLLAALATLQWRWIGEVSDADRQRLETRLLAAGMGFAQDFDREITRAFLYFHPDTTPPAEEHDGQDAHSAHPAHPAHPAIAARVARQYDRWRAEAPYPRLIKAVFLIERHGDETELSRLEPEARRFAPFPLGQWPAELDAVRPRLESEHHHHFGMQPGQPRVIPELPGLIVPLSFPSHGPHGPHGDPPEAREDSRAGYLLLKLDESVMRSELLPALTRQYFRGPEEGEYAVAVVDSGVRGPGLRVIYSSDPSLSGSALADLADPADRADRAALADLNGAEVRLDILGLRPFEELHSLWAGRPRMRWRTSAGAMESAGPTETPGAPAARREDGHNRRSASWTLLVKRRQGSLEQAVAAIRRRNLAVSLGILTLLACTTGALWLQAQRAQRLARQQIEFVAGVTHELNTPLTAIRSAGENLADGVVAQPEQVRRYGALIESEGRRLSNMVAQLLELAGIQTGRRVYRPEPVALAPLVEEALAENRWLLEGAQIEVDTKIDPGLPAVMMDRASLRRAIQNLIENAVKYGGEERWLGLRAWSEGGVPGPAPGTPGVVALEVADRGPGIARQDLPHLFEPFFRGESAQARGIPGSGLGLSLVRHVLEAHGGRVSVAPGPAGRGSAFTLRLPAVAAAAPPRTTPGSGADEAPS